MTTVTADLIRATVAEGTPPPVEPAPAMVQGRKPAPSGTWDVRAFLERHGQTVIKEKPFKGGTLYVLSQCPFNPDHTAGESAVFKPANGPLSFKCFHNSCDGKTWRDLRRAIGAEQKPPKKTDAPMDERKPLILADWRVPRAFPGRPGTREYLCADVFARGLPHLLAAMGGVGKSYSLLSLCAAVARGECRSMFAPMHFGGRLLAEGTAVYVSGEDDGITLHERIEALCGEARPERLIAVPCPDAGGAPLFFRLDERKTASATEDWWDFRRQLMEIKDLVLVCIDPLQIVSALDLNLPENAQIVCRHISELASKTKAAVILAHHFRKPGSGKDVDSPEAARDAIRGSAGLVDGVRLTYAMWTPKDASSIAKQLGVKFVRGDVVQGAAVKGNGKYNKGVQTYLRANSGLLMDMSHQLVGADNTALRDTVLATVAAAAVAGRPFTKTGTTGVWSRRFEFAQGVQALSKHRQAALLDELLERGDLVQCMAPGSTACKWLDIPTGPFALGQGEFEPGHGPNN